MEGAAAECAVDKAGEAEGRAEAEGLGASREAVKAGSGGVSPEG